MVLVLYAGGSLASIGVSSMGMLYGNWLDFVFIILSLISFIIIYFVQDDGWNFILLRVTVINIQLLVI